MEVPKGVVNESGKVCKLVKSLYGLKQSPRQWNSKFDSFLKRYAFAQSKADPCVYHGCINDVYVFLAVFVDDGLLMAESKDALNEVIKALKSSFEVTEGDTRTFVGIQIERDRENHSIFIHQTNYTERIEGVTTKCNRGTMSPKSL